jgi:hypothetical protein
MEDPATNETEDHTGRVIGSHGRRAGSRESGLPRVPRVQSESGHWLHRPTRSPKAVAE